MIREVQGRFEVSGAMNLTSANVLADEGGRCIEALMQSASLSAPKSHPEHEILFDLGQVTEIDSSGLAIIFSWMRAARNSERSIKVTNPPESLLVLAELYGVTELLPLNRENSQ